MQEATWWRGIDYGELLLRLPTTVDAGWFLPEQLMLCGRRACRDYCSCLLVFVLVAMDNKSGFCFDRLETWRGTYCWSELVQG